MNARFCIWQQLGSVRHCQVEIAAVPAVLINQFEVHQNTYNQVVLHMWRQFTNELATYISEFS